MKRLLLFIAALGLTGLGMMNAQEATTVSFSEALTIGQALGKNVTTSTTYRTTGVVSQVKSTTANVTQYHNCDFLIVDPTGAATTSITCYRTKWLGNTNMAAADMPNEGDTVTVVGPIQNYNSNTVEFYLGYIESISRYAVPVVRDTIDVDVCGAMAAAASLTSGQYSFDYYRVTGVVDTITFSKASAMQQTFRMNCPTTAFFTAYNAIIQGDKLAQVGDTVVVFGRLQNYNGTIEISGAEVTIIGPYVEPVIVPEPDPIVLGFQAPEEWENVFIYSWNTQTSTGNWPGTQLTKDSLGWVYFPFVGDEEVNYIWNNGNGGAGNQTVDLTANSSKCERVGGTDVSGKYVISFAECGSVLPQPIDTTAQDTTPVITIHDVTVAEALTVGALLGYSETTTDLYRVHGVVSNVVTWKDKIVSYGNCNLYIQAPGDSAELYCYKTNWLGNATFTNADDIPVVGDTVTVVGPIQNYKGNTIELMQGYIESIARYVEPLPIDTTGQDTIPAMEPIVMRLSKTSADAAGWENVYAYVWDNDYVNYFGTWPGTYVQLDSTGNWYEVQVDPNFAPFNLIWNNGVGGGMTQTIDLMDISTSQCHGLRHGEYLTNYAVTLLDCDAIDTLPSPESTFYTVYFTMPWAMGATLIDSVIVAAGQSAIAPATPVVDGYEFMGWNASLSEIWYDQTISASYKLVYPDSVESRTPITVRIQASSVPETWENLYLFSWTVPYGSEARTGQGVLLTADSTGWYTYTFDRAVTSVDFLLNNGDWGFGNQTVDVNDLTASYCLQMGAPLADTLAYHMIYLTDCGFDPYIPTETLPEDDRLTVRLIKPAYGWQHVYLFQWDDNGALLGEWPGIELTPDSLGWCSYTFPYDTVVNIIWNSGVSNGNLINQTQDITGLNHSADFRLNGNFYDENREAFLTLADELPAGANPADYHTVAFMDLDFTNDPLMVKQVLHGDIVGTTPNIPSHDGYVFKNWIHVDPTTFQLIDYVYDSTVVVADMLVDELYDHATYMVYVLNWDGQLLGSGQVYHGYSVNNLNDFVMPREGYEFIGWTDDLQYVTKTTFTIAMYRPIATGNTTVIYSDKDGYYMTQEDVTLNLPQAPAIEGYEFIRWDVIGGDLRNGIRIQAIYEDNTSTGAPEVNGQQNAARKELREGIVYVLKDNAIYTVTGQKVQ